MISKSVRHLAASSFLALFSPLLFLACSTPQGDSAKTVKNVRLLHISDTHAQLETHWEYLPEDPSRLHQMGGFARLKTAFDRLRASAPGPVFSTDGGDTFQGSAIAAWTEGESVLGPLNALRLDVGIPGNWEVTYGPERFKKLMSSVNYKVIAYNFEDANTGKKLFPSYELIEKDGVRIAFFGLTDSTTSERQPPAQVKGLNTKHSEGLREMIQKVKSEENPDLIVLISHEGLTPNAQLAQRIPEIDVLLSGHSHERTYRQIKIGNTLLVEPGSMGSFIGQLDLRLEKGKIADSSFALIPVTASEFPEDPTVQQMIVDSEKAYRSRMDKIVGQTRTPLMRYDVLEGTMDNVVADAVRAATRSDVAFTNGFRFSPPIAAGPIREYEIWNALPQDAPMKVGSVTGTQLKNYLENELELVFSQNPSTLSGGWGPRPSGMEFVFKAKAPKGQRIEKLTVGGKLLDPQRVYTISGCEREGEAMNVICRMGGVSNAKYVNMTVHQALKKYLKAKSPLNAVREQRAVATDLPTINWSQYGLLQKMWQLPGDSEAMRIPSQK